MSPHDDSALLSIAAAVADRTPVDWNHEAGSRPDLQPRLRPLRVLETLTALHGPAPADPMVGTSLSHYRVVEHLGAGGMGVVYEAEDVHLRRRVALKVLPPELTRDPDRRACFLREARAAAAVTHPNIATIHEIGEQAGVLFIAMELVDGRTLRSLIGGRPLPIKDAVRIATELAEALSRAHQAHVIHRDLKPDNVIVTPDGHPKVLDFGLAKLRDEHRQMGGMDPSRLQTISAELTREGKVFGTPAYMSPEQARGQEVDLRSDLFSFGTMVYEMVTGRVPFEGKTATDLLSAIILDRPAPASARNPEVSAELDRILGRCLEKDPADRYQHTDPLVVDLRKLRRTTDAGVQAGRTPGAAAEAQAPVTVWGRVVARRAVRRALVAGAAALVIAAGGLATWRATRLEAGFKSGDRILVADFDNTTGRPEFDSAVRDAFENMLAFSTLVQVIRGESRKELVKKHVGAETYRIDGELAGRICRAGSCAGFLIGRIEPERDGFRLEAGLHQVGRKEPVAARSSAVPAEPELLRGIHEIVLDLRREIRENPRAVSGTLPPATRSLLAYQPYAAQFTLAFSPEEGVALLKRALEIDPEFADAWSDLAIHYFNLGDEKAYRKYVEEAYRRSSGLTEQARLLKEILVFDASFDYDAMIEHLTSYRRLYPFDASAANWLGMVHYQAYEDPLSAEPSLRDAYEIRPEAVGYGNLIGCLGAQGKIDAIERLVDDFKRRGWTRVDGLEDDLMLPRLRRDLPAIRETLDRRERDGSLSRSSASMIRFEYLLSFGRLREAHEAGAVAWSEVIKSRNAGAHQGIGLQQAWLELRRTGRPPELHPAILSATEGSLLRLYNLATYAVESGPVEPLARIIEAHASTERGSKSRYVREELEFARGCLAFSRGEARAARALLEPLARSREFQRRHHVLGRVYESLGLWPEAAAEYERVLKEPYKVTLFSPAVQILDQFRLAGIYERLAQPARARHWYERFLEEWNEADPDLPEVIEARQHLLDSTQSAGAPN